MAETTLAPLITHNALSRLAAQFADLIVRVLESCKKWKTIKPTRTNLIGEGYELTTLGAHVDGELPSFGWSVYFLSAHKITKEGESMIGASKSKVSKRTVPANEAQARPLGMDIVVKIVEDPIIGKLIRLAHLGDLEGKGTMHRTTSGTMGRLHQGSSGLLLLVSNSR